VRYIHIPLHAVQDFRDFAKGVAAQACRDVATNNPYVQALNKHRAELQSPLGLAEDPFDPGDQPSLAQLLSTQRDSCSLIPAGGHWLSADGRLLGEDEAPDECGANAEPIRKCGGWLGRGGLLAPMSMRCCSNGGDTGDFPVDELALNEGCCIREDARVQPLPTVGGGSAEFTPPSLPVSARGSLAAPCSRQQQQDGQQRQCGNGSPPPCAAEQGVRVGWQAPGDEAAGPAYCL